MTRIFLVFLFFSSVCWGQFIEDAAPKKPTYDPFSSQVFFDHEPLPEQPGSEVILEQLEGLLLVGDIKDISDNGIKGVRGLQVKNLVFPGTIEELRARIQPIFLHKPLTMELIRQLRMAIVQYYQDYHRGLVLVVAPEQNIIDDTLQLLVIESRAGQVSVEGNKWFKTQTLHNHFRLEQAQYINTEVIVQDLDWINRNPFRQADVIMRPGEVFGTTDVEFWVYDRLPWRVYAGADNTGFETTGTGRLFTGFNWGNAFGLEQQLSFQYTTSTDFGRYYSYTGSWAIPLPWRHIWSFFGGYSRVHPKMPFIGMENTGTNSQVSTRYTMPIPRQRTFTQEVSVGIDYKRANNNLLFGDLIIFGSTAVITQAVFEYLALQKLDNWRWALNFDLYWSPGDLFGHQSNKDYQSLRPFAQSNYVYGNYTFLPVIYLPRDWSLVLKNSVQLSNRNLLSSETFGLGGYDTVRGYDQRDVNTDNGVLLSGQIMTPPMPLFTYRKPEKILRDQLQFLWFFDYGLGWNNNRLPEEPHSFWLGGVGPGLRYNWGTYLTVRLDWGIKLHKLDFTKDTSFSRVDFGLLLAY
ncbi:MAG: ShlB/FhaC/HecB family hemolysin secretion/activation protein [Chlamydiia bacterium]|nr:ShlB/FhaC/HecB family hemolysin secretion/activation protein [Chlamydiia bacterium]